MSKPAITRLFIGSIVAFVAAIVLAIVAVVAMFADGAVVMDGSEVVGFEPTTFTWTMVAVAAVAALVMGGAAIGGLIAWIGALLNTSHLEDKTWFILLLVLGLFSFGFIAMVLYLIAGPDGTLPAPPREQRPMQHGGVPA